MLEKNSSGSQETVSVLCVFWENSASVDTISEKNKLTRTTFRQLLIAKLKCPSPQNRFDLAQEEEAGG